MPHSENLFDQFQKAGWDKQYIIGPSSNLSVSYFRSPLPDILLQSTVLVEANIPPEQIDFGLMTVPAFGFDTFGYRSIFLSICDRIMELQNTNHNPLFAPRYIMLMSYDILSDLIQIIKQFPPNVSSADDIRHWWLLNMLDVVFDLAPFDLFCDDKIYTKIKSIDQIGLIGLAQRICPLPVWSIRKVFEGEDRPPVISVGEEEIDAYYSKFAWLLPRLSSLFRISRLIAKFIFYTLLSFSSDISKIDYLRKLLVLYWPREQYLRRAELLKTTYANYTGYLTYLLSTRVEVVK